MSKNIRVVELFAGVGGFRLGLEGWNGKSATSGYTNNLNSNYKVVWSNQWEPATKVQHASMVYENRWGKANHSNEDIETVNINQIPDHELLVGGFPCQDYSVATTLKNSKGLIGKKGVLWWSIHRILTEIKKKPKYLLLENVDRLLISPASQRGRDYAIMLQSLNELGYAVEWRVINAAEYGMPQRRRRIFFLAYHKDTSLYSQMNTCKAKDWITKHGTIAKAFPVELAEKTTPRKFTLVGSLVDISNNFNVGAVKTTFENSGIMIDGKVTTLKTTPSYNGDYTTLGDIILNGTSKIPDEFLIPEDQLKRWEYLKGGKKLTRTNAEGFQYEYSEGSMNFPEPLDMPSRTIITGEGGISPSRFKHVVKQDKIGYRRLTPIELERLDMFPDDHTQLKGITDAKRAFFMGNALVVGVVEKLGIELAKRM